MGILDSVTLGAIAAVAVSIVIFVFLVFKIKALMNEDAEAHKK